jgi:PAS domain S-box-containing protein
VSTQWLDYTGVPEVEQLGYGWLDRVHPDDRDRVREEWKTAVSAGAPLDTELRLRGQHGTARWFSARSVPIHDQSGAMVRWYGLCSDIENMKRASVEREHTAERLAGILDGIEEAVLALDHALVITDVNSAAERMFEKRRSDIVGKPFFDVFRGAEASLEPTLREVMGAKSARAIEATIADGAPSPRTRAVRLYPHAGGISLLCLPGGGAKR